jgi:hypothetical protein
MSDVVDPGPIIDERLHELAAQHEPTVTFLDHALESASAHKARALKKELRRARRVYIAAQQDVIKALRGPGVKW